ncbi:glycosyl transferase [Flavobacterium oreochromis]|uniref:Glycosyl transferase n=2 Tax=Flavobacterium TaxID=237 RepID=A0A246GFC3_9FLAO|nr:glycosyl transferase [Flavobacterium oreochromis]
MKISVALCTYNGEKYLKEQILSILNQTKKVDEIIICDDISSDNTFSIINNFAKENPNIFKIYKNENNLKSVKNFEKAINLCNGDIIFLSDQDDIWCNNKVEDYIKYFIEHPEINVIASNGFYIDENSKKHEMYSIWDVPKFLKEKKIDFNYHQLTILGRNIATGASMAFRRIIIEDILPFPTIDNFHHDEWIAMITSSKNQFSFLDKQYFYYRIHNNQQVGGVFYKKNKSEKQKLLDIFNFESPINSFNIYKKRIRKLISNYKLNSELEKTNLKLSSLFKSNKEIIIKQYQRNKRQMKKKHPIKFFLLSISDKILNKRNFD